MTAIEKIIDDLKNVKWEEQSRTAIETERLMVAGYKITIPFAARIMKVFLRKELDGHASDALASRMFAHYLDGGGEDFTLTLDEMRAMNAAKIDLRVKGQMEPTVNPEWTAACARARATGLPQAYVGKAHWVWDNGAISTYLVTYSGQVSALGGVCEWRGQVDFFDRFDLDPRWTWSPTNPQGRSRGGERRTRIGYILNLGTDYDMKSPKVITSQKETDPAISLLAPTASPSSGNT